MKNMKNIPSDCLIVKPKEGVSPFTHLTWNSNGCPKTIPLHIYKLNEYRLIVVEDPNYLLTPNPEAVPTPPPKKDEPEDKEKEAEEKPTEPEEKTEKPDFVKEAKDVSDAILDGDLGKASAEAKDLMDKVKKVGKGKDKKR